MKRYIAIYVLFSMFLLSGCGHVTYHNLEANDAISRAIYEAVGEDVYYQGKSDASNINLYYEYILCAEKSELLFNMVTAINETIEQEGITEKVVIRCYAEIPGGLESIVLLQNYSDDALDYPNYEYIQKLVIVGDEIGMMGGDYFYDNPAVYTNLPDIKCLVVSEKIQETAEAEGIDWYEYWPDLEKFDILSDGE